MSADPRIVLRDSPVVNPDETEDLLRRLARLDASAPSGLWTVRTLKLLQERPGVRASDLCQLIGQEKEQFKLNVRKLKGLGLTESLETGYRLSVRGNDLLNKLLMRDVIRSG